MGTRQSPPVRFYTRTDAEKREQRNETYEGAAVIEPKPGYYGSETEAMLVLDWQGLYPAIAVTHNLCGTTLVQPDYDLTLDPTVQRCADPANELTLDERLRRAEAAVWRVPHMVSQKPYREEVVDESAVFLKHSVMVSITTIVLQDKLGHRARTKSEMKAAYVADDEELGDLLDQRQLAIKMLANSIYGVFGATVSFAYTPKVSSTITLRGRCYLYLMRNLAETLPAFKDYDPSVEYGGKRQTCGPPMLIDLTFESARARRHRFDFRLPAQPSLVRRRRPHRRGDGQGDYRAHERAVHARSARVQHSGARV